MEEIERRIHGSPVKLAPVESGQISVIAVSPGTGITRIFASLGVSGIVEGGQTMNPSTEDILESFENLPTDKVIILPNNNNIIMAAKSSAELTVKDVAVIPSRTIPQGLAAMLRFLPDGDFKQVIDEMESALGEVITGEITTAVRDAIIDNVDVQEGEIIGLLNQKLVYASHSLEETCLGLLDKADAEEYELVTLIHGANVAKQNANQIADKIRSTYPDLEVELHDGGQPHYHFIISID
jgi:dihydroxyacetone kinase-like predicted kinase